MFRILGSAVDPATGSVGLITDKNPGGRAGFDSATNPDLRAAGRSTTWRMTKNCQRNGGTWKKIDGGVRSGAKFCAIYPLAILTQPCRLRVKFAQPMRARFARRSSLELSRVRSCRCPMSRHEQPNFDHRRDMRIARKFSTNVIASGDWRARVDLYHEKTVPIKALES